MWVRVWADILGGGGERTRDDKKTRRQNVRGRGILGGCDRVAGYWKKKELYSKGRKTWTCLL